MTFVYSIGRSRYDAWPIRRAAETLREFAADVLSRRAVNKESAGYVCAPFGGDGRRSATNAAPRRWLALDVDSIDCDALPAWRLFLCRWRGFGWPTASSTPEAPRERVIIELSAPVTRAEGISLGALLAQDVEDEFGVAVRLDRCTFRAEQPCFLALQQARPFFLQGAALDVPAWLALVQPAPPPPPPALALDAARADAEFTLLVGTLARAGMLRAPLDNGRGYAVCCPWGATHTSADGPGSTATALLAPSEANGWRGGFRCLHSHCDGRGLRDLRQRVQEALKSVEAAHA